MVVGLLKFFKGAPSWFYGQPWGFLAGAYVILAFPYMFFSLDAGFSSIDVHTLTEASQSLGARWTHDALQGDPPEHPRGGARGVVPRARDRDGRVHDREPLGLPHLPDLHPVRERDARLPGGSADVDELRHHLAAMGSLLLVGRKRGARAAVVAGAR